MKKVAALCLCLVFLAIGLMAQQKKNKQQNQASINSSGEIDKKLLIKTDDSLFFIYKKRIRTKQRTIKVWLLKEPLRSDGLSSQFLYELNCNQELVRIRSRLFYKPDGKLLTSTNEMDEWADIAPDTLADEIRKEVCKK